MGYEIVWTPASREDMTDLLGYISRDSVENALSVIDRIERAVERLREFPLSGHYVHELPDEDVRELIVFDYRILYEFTTHVEILGVFHGSRLLSNAMKGRL